MNSLIKEKVDLLHQKIKEEGCIKEYLFYKKMINAYPEWKTLEKEVHTLQKMVVRGRYEGNDDQELEMMYALKRKELEDNPWIRNYIESKEEAKHYLEHISLYISSRL